MQLQNIPFETADWTSIPAVEHAGVTGVARWRTRQLGELRIRMVEYTPGYVADRWCRKGHILRCLEGTLHPELADGRRFVLTAGMSYHVADDAEPHRSSAPEGARLFIVD